MPVDMYSGLILAQRPILLPFLKDEQPNDKVLPSTRRRLVDLAHPAP